MPLAPAPTSRACGNRPAPAARRSSWRHFNKVCTSGLCSALRLHTTSCCLWPHDFTMSPRHSWPSGALVYPGGGCVSLPACTRAQAGSGWRGALTSLSLACRPLEGGSLSGGRRERDEEKREPCPAVTCRPCNSANGGAAACADDLISRLLGHGRQQRGLIERTMYVSGWCTFPFFSIPVQKSQACRA